MSSTIRLEKTSERVSDQLVGTPAELRLEPDSAENVVPIRDEARSAPISLSQERFWFLDQINPGDASSNLFRGIRINGDLNQDLLQRSLATIGNRHDSLRATFATSQLHAGRDSRPVQLIAAYRPVEMPLIDLSHEPLNQREVKARELARQAAQLTFDLTLGPLLRATLLKLADREHVLLLNVHRIVCDESSLQIIVDEMWACYSAFARGSVDPLSSPQMQYADYAVWQRKLIEEESFTAELDFWRGNLEGAPAVIELPTDRPKPAVRTWHGKSVCQKLNNELLEQLRALAGREHVALDTVLLAALKVVLSRHSGQHDLVVGTVISNRDQPGAKHLVGPLSNLLILRTSLAGDPTFREFLFRVQNTTYQAHDHRLAPLETLLSELRLERSLSHTPLFQVTFNLVRAQHTSDEAVGLKLEEFDFDAGITSFDLTVDAFESANHLSWRFGYSTDLFDHPTIERLGGHLNSVLEAVASNPGQRVSALPLMTQPERRQMLEEWNETGVANGKDCCLHEMFEEQAEKRASEIALVWGSEQLSYGELNRRANQLAHYLKQRGVGPEVLVGVCVKRSLEMVVGIMGILKAGGAYVPLDPGYPAERLRFMLEDAKAWMLLTQERLLPQLPETSAEVVCLDRDWEEISKESEGNAGAGVGPGNLAYVIYTSGSTGQPKGVAIEHRSAVTLLGWAGEVFTAADLSGVLAATSICFDLSVFELFVPLSYGGKVVMADDVLELPTLPAAQEVKLINTVPSAMVELLRLGGLPESVETVNLAGEPLAARLVEQLYELAHIRRVYDLYGPSEDTTYSTYALRVPAGRATIGRPISNTRTYLLDRTGQPVPIGVPGEIYLGGAGLARGYLKRPEHTAKAFLPDPFSGSSGARLYKTGDLGRYLEDGKIEYLGRSDNQVKVRGYRIELGEIEAVLRKHPFVREVAVVVRQGKLVGYVVVSPEHLVNGTKLGSELRSFLQTKLPGYMSPALFVELDALPLTPNGKVDRRALPTPDKSRPDLPQAYVASRDRLEEQLATLWTNVLQLNSIGVRDNFFELGGDSLLAARLFAQIENRFGKHLPLATLFQSPTIEQLANVLRETGTSRAWSSLVAIQPEGSRPPLFCVHAAGANVLIYRPMARHLGNDQPVYALQAQGLDGQSPPLKRVEDMAELYIKEIRAFQPEGPYFLLGASFGGLVAFEMAQRLLAQGQQVALLAMLNTNCPAYTLAKRVRCHVGHLMERGLRGYVSEVGNTIKRRRANQAVLGNSGSENSRVPDPELAKVLEGHREVDESLVRTVRAILDAEQDYALVQKVYPGKITFFWAQDAVRDFEDNRLGWRRIAAGGFDMHVVPGTHTSMREEPCVAELVEKLKPYVQKRY